MAEHYELLANLAYYSEAGYGVAIDYFKQHKFHVEHLLTEIERLHVKTYNQYGKFNTNEFFRDRKLLFQQLDGVLKSLVGRGYTGLDIDRNKIKRSLGLSTKSLVHRLKDHPVPVSKIPEFAKNHAKVRNYGKVLRGLGYVAIALDGVHSVATVRQACTTGREQDCTKSKFSEGGRFAGSVAGGGFGGWAGYGLCNLLFGIETAGTSLLWCGIVAGGAGGFIGGNAGGEFLQGGGELLYENHYR